MADSTEKVLFEIRLDDEQYKQETKLIRDSLAALVLDIDKTKTQQKQLNEQRKAGTVTDAEYAKQAVNLRTQLRGQQADQRELEKGLETLGKTFNSSAGSAEQLRGALKETTTAFYAMSEAERKSAEGQALQKQALAISDALKEIEGSVGSTGRNVGNYAASFKQGLEPLVVELAKVRAQQQGLDKDSESYQVLEKRAIGFQTAAVKAGAQAGLSFEQAEAKVVSYAAQIQPAVENLVRLEQEEKHLAETGQEASESFRKIGFQIAAVEKEIAKVPTETEKVATATEKVNDGLDHLSDTARELPGPLGDTVGGLAGTAKSLLSVTKASLAFIATPLGLVLAAIALALYAVKTAFASSEEGQNKYTRLMGVLGTVLGNVVDLAADLGEAIIGVFEKPGESAEKFGNLLKDQIVNRIVGLLELVPALGSALVKLFRGDISGASKQAADAVGKIVVGVDSVTDSYARASDAVRKFGLENLNEAQAAGKVADQRAQADKLERELITERAQKEAEIAAFRLKARQEDQFSAADRKQALLAAQKLQDGLIDKEKQVVELRRDAIVLENTFSRTNKENLTKEEEAKAAVIKLDAQRLEEQRAMQREFNRLNNQLAGADKARVDAAAKAAEQRLADLRAQLKLENDLIDQQLRKTPEGSDEELQLQAKKLENSRKIELAQKGLTLGAKRLLDIKYENDRDELVLSHAKQRATIELDAARSNIAAQLAATREGGAEELQLQQELIQLQLQQQLAALDKRKDNTAKEKELRAQAAKQLADLEFNAALAGLETELQARRNLINQQYADEKLTKQQQEDALLAIDKAGLEARLVAQQDYGRSTVETQAQINAQEAAARDRKVAKDKEALEKRQAYEDARLQSASDVTEGIIELFGEETTVGQAALAIKKTLALAEIAINLQRELSAIAAAAAANPANIVTAGVAGISQNTILSAIAIAKAALAAAKVVAFRRGGVAYDPDGHVAKGPSHEQGGIPLYSRRTGRSVGIEIEGDEIILTKNVFRNPALRAAASALNVAAGGRPFAQGLRQLGAIPRHYAQGGIVRYDPATMDPMRAGTNNVQVIQQPIDYDVLTDMMAAKLGPTFVAGAQALPAPTLQPTQFNRVAENERRAQIQSNN